LPFFLHGTVAAAARRARWHAYFAVPRSSVSAGEPKIGEIDAFSLGTHATTRACALTLRLIPHSDQQLIPLCTGGIPRSPFLALLGCQSASARGSGVVISPLEQGEAAVDLALKWDVLAVCAVFAFVGAVLLGAF
jgi:hypothetical protein